MAHPPAYQAVTFGTAGASLRRFEPFQVGLRQCPSERNGQMSGYTANPFPSLVPLPLQTGAKARGFSPTALESTAETDSPLEGSGFELPVPLRALFCAFADADETNLPGQGFRDRKIADSSLEGRVTSELVSELKFRSSQKIRFSEVL